MTKELHELETNYLILEQQLLSYAAVHYPQVFSQMKEWLNSIQTLNVTERTLYLAEMTEELLVKNKYENDWTQLEQKMKNEKISDETIAIFAHHFSALQSL